MKTTKILSLALFSLLSLNLHAQSYIAWTALRIGNKMRTNADVEHYITATRLNPEAKMQLFKLAENDYGKYREIKTAVLQEQFESGLKELAYALLLETDATQGLGRNKNDRRGFMVTDREYNQAVQENENKHLRKYLDQRLGIVKARELFGEELIEKGYPHRTHETATDVYWNWYEYQKNIITEAFRKREVEKYEYVMATQKFPNLELRPFDISDFKRKLDTVIDTQLQGKRLTQAQINQIAIQNPGLNLRVKNFHQVSLHTMALGRMESLPGSARHKVEESYQIIERNFFQELNQSKIERILQYEEMAHTLAQRYQTAQELEELSKQRMDTFIAGGTYNDFMMARLYTLGAKLKSGQPKRQLYRQQLARELEVAFSKLQSDISSRNLVQNNKSLLFEDLVARNLQEQLSELRGQRNYLSDMVDMAVWVIKFDAKKASLQDQVIVQIEKQEDHFESYRALEGFLKNQLYIEGLQHYYRHELSKNAYLLEINLDGRRRLSSHQAFDFIMKDLINP